MFPLPLPSTMFVVALVALLGLAAAQLDLSDRTSISVDASVYLHLEVDQVYYKKPAGNSTDRVVFQFSKTGLSLPVKDKLTDETSSETTLTRPQFFQASVCVATAWSNATKATLPKPLVVVDDKDTYINQWIDYADIIMYADFERPYFEFQADAFIQGTASNSCLPTATDVVVRQNFSERLCYTEDTFCNVWVGDNSDGWLYFGGGNTSTTGTFGVHVNPRWNWTGTRELFEINGTNVLDVRPVDSTSDSFEEAKTLIAAGTPPPFEFNECIIREDGVLVFHVNANGRLERQLSCNSLELEDYSSVVFDFANKFDESLLSAFKLDENRWNFTFNIIRVKYASSFDVQIDPENYQEPWVELNRLPKDYYLDGANWLTTITYNSASMDVVKTWFTIEKSVSPTTTVITTPRPTVTTLPKPVCAKDCNSHGTCNANNQCTCTGGWEASAVEGCVDPVEKSTAAITNPPPSITTEVVVGTTVATVPTTKEPIPTGTNTIPFKTTPPTTATTVSGSGAADSATQVVLSFATVLLALLVAL